MQYYQIGQTLLALQDPPPPEQPSLLLLTSDERISLPDSFPADAAIRHTPLGREAHITKAEVHRGFLCGTVRTPRFTKSGNPIAFGYLLSGNQLVLCDDSGSVQTQLQRMIREKRDLQESIARFCYTLFELLIGRDLHHLEELEDQLAQMEEQVLSSELDGVSPRLSALNQEILHWMRFYSQMDDMICEFQENENGLLPEQDEILFRLLEKRVGRLMDETKLLREYCVQVREMYQTEIGIQQNQIMKILTIVTTVFLPLSILVGWYGMNFTGMPELTWKYGYPALIVVSILIILITLWWIHRKKFW